MSGMMGQVGGWCWSVGAGVLIAAVAANQDGVVISEWLWAGGRLRTAVTFGIPFGLVIGTEVWVFSGSVIQAVIDVPLAGAMSGGFMAVMMWRGWPRGGKLPPADRVAVLRAVQRGERVSDPRLVPEVLAYAKVMLRAADREQRQRWVLCVFAAGIAAWAAVVTVTGSAAQLAYAWTLAVIFFGLVWWSPRRFAHRRRDAAKAARLASVQSEQ
jgi:hypothetical protein